MFAASKSGNAESKDPQFNYVTMLLHGDGTNGAQNNTFLDSSTNNFTITRNGNTTQGSFSPYGSNWSNYFDGSSYLSVAANSALNQSGDFTIEGWVNLSATPSVIVPIYGFENVNFLKVGFNSSRQVTVDQSQVGVKVTGTTAVSLGTWNHIALVRSGSSSNNCKIYLNGVQEGQFTDTSTSTVSGTGYIFRRSDNTTTVAGYLSNLRVTNTAVYTSAFTPSTTPLTAVSGTSLLTCQSNRFIDNSSNAFAITTTGAPSVQRFNPFGTATAYSTSVIGGSGYFDGAGDYLVTSGTGSFNPRSTFTIEFWTYPISSITQIEFISSNTNNLFYFETFNNDLYIGDGSINTIGTTPPQLNRWTHVLLSFDGTTYRLFYNGVSQATSTSLLASNTITAFRIAQKNSGSYPFTGYMGDMRVLVGTALYTSAFTPPTTPLTAITNTTLLLNYTNGAIFDNAMMNDLETVGNAQISTSVKKYGTGSLAFDGTGDNLIAPSSPNLSFGTGDFTIEGWVYLNSVSGFQTLVSIRISGSDATTGHYSLAFRNAALEFYASGGTVAQGGTASISTWTHFACTRSSGSVRLFLNGTQVGSTASFTTSIPQKTVSVGSNNGGSEYLNGYIDDLRITTGYARYTANFTAPTAAFPNTGPI